MQRRALNAVALALAVAGAPALGGAQSRTIPPDTPKLLVVVFSSPVRAQGVEVADAVRQRFTSQMNPRVLAIITREHMVSFLESSGYKADSSLGVTDLKELARGLRADNLLGGEVVKTGSTYKVSPRMMLALDPSVSQPLPLVETSSLNEAARQAERAYHEARKQLPDDVACKNHIRSALDVNGKVTFALGLDRAIASANAGIVKYPNATIVRLCMVNAYLLKQQWDSVLAVVDVIKRIDPNSKQANEFAVEANKQKADAETDPAKQLAYREAAVQLLVGLLRNDPYSQTLQTKVLNELARMNRPAVAIPIVDDLLKMSPGDPPLLKMRWQFIGLDAAAAGTDTASKIAKLGRYLTAGEEMVKSDTMLADSTYYFRQVAAAMLVSPQKGSEWASKAVAKYPTNQDYWWYKARMERGAGQTDAASKSLSRLLQLNPRYPNATVMLGQLYIDQRMFDSAVALARRSVAAGESRETWGRFLVSPTNAQYQRADTADKAATADTANKEKRLQATREFEATLALAQESDRMAPTAQAAFFIGVSSFQIGYAMVNRVQATQGALARAQGSKQPPRPAEVATQRASMCSDAKRAQDMFLLTMTNMPRGGSVSPQVAQQLLGATGQMSPFADQAATTFCRPLPPPTKAGTPPPTKAPSAP